MRKHILSMVISPFNSRRKKVIAGPQIQKQSRLRIGSPHAAYGETYADLFEDYQDLSTFSEASEK